MSDVAYLTATELRQRITDLDVEQILDDLPNADARDVYLNQAALSGSQTLEGYAGGSYALPLVSTGQVKDLVTRIVRFSLLRRKPWNFTDAQHEDEKALTALLEQISRRLFHLVGQSPARSIEQQTSIREGSPSARSTGRQRKLTREQMDGF